MTPTKSERTLVVLVLKAAGLFKHEYKDVKMDLAKSLQCTWYFEGRKLRTRRYISSICTEKRSTKKSEVERVHKN